MWVQGIPQNISCFSVFEELHLVQYGKDKWMAAAVGWCLLLGNQCPPRGWSSDYRRKLEELRLEKDVRLSSTLLASGLADKVEEQDTKL